MTQIFGEGLDNVFGSLTRIKYVIVLILTMVDKQGESLVYFVNI